MSINIKASNGRLQLSFTVASKRHYLSLGLGDTKANRKIAQATAVQIERDISLGIFDDSLNRYRPNYRAPQEPSLVELWSRYEVYRQPQVAETTFKTQYRTVRNHISRLPTHKLQEAPKIRDYLLAQYSPVVTKKTLVQLNAACKWGVASGILQSNPFQNIPQSLQVPKVSRIYPFSREEMVTIIQAFETTPRYAHYTNLVKFFFWTGCRTGEAIALQWRHISPDCSRIRFEQSRSSSLGVLKSTKNHKSRVFPCSPNLQALLQRMPRRGPEDWVFLNEQDKAIGESQFNHHVWGGYSRKGKEYPGLVKQLAYGGQIEAYRPQYNTRHTFATLALQSGLSVADVAVLIGDTPGVVLTYYAAARRDLVAPNI